MNACMVPGRMSLEGWRVEVIGVRGDGDVQSVVSPAAPVSLVLVGFDAAGAGRGEFCLGEFRNLLQFPWFGVEFQFKPGGFGMVAHSSVNQRS